MDVEFTSFAQSQDILATLTHRQIDIAVEREPWFHLMLCLNLLFAPQRAVLDLGCYHHYEKSTQISLSWAPYLFRHHCLELQIGIDICFIGRFFKIFRRLSSSPSIANMKEFMQVLGLIEFTGMDVGMTDKVASCYRTYLSRFLLKVGSLSKAVSSLPVNACSQNIPFHAALFSWGAACKLLAQRQKSEPLSSDECLLTAGNAFVVLLDGLAVLRKSCGSAVPCSCVQSILLELYKTQSNQLLQSSFHIVQSLTKGESPYPPNQRHALGSLMTTSENFLVFFSEVISHLVDIRMIASDEIMARFVLVAGMGDLLCDTALLPTCKVLLSFLQKYNVKGLVKIRKFASKFVTKILQTVDAIDLPELEKLSRGDPTRWAEGVTNSFKYCAAEEPLLIAFLARLLSGVKLLISGCVLPSMLSMLLALVAGIEEWEELPAKVCEWISGAIVRANETQCTMFFNALDVLNLVVNERDFGKKANITSTVINCMNSLPLPERSKVFATRFSSMLRYSKQLASIDVNRFVTAVSTPELLGFLYSLVDAPVEIPGSIWDKAASLLASRPADGKLREFVVNQLSIGLESRSPQSMSRFKSTVEKMNCAHPDADFLFAFCNGVLARLPKMDTKRFTSLIWDHIMRMLNNVVPSATMELSPGNSEAFVTKFFTALGSSTVSGDLIRKIIADSVPIHLANQIVVLLKNDDREMQVNVTQQ
ncbi:hypothetical protein COOONC_21738 [Cooperia oncophora]